MVISSLLFILAGGLIVRGIPVIKKQQEIKYAYNFALDKMNIKESVSMATGATTLSLVDIYAACENHKEVLKVLEYRYNNVMGNASAFQWYSKIEELFQNGEKSIDSYVNGYVGQAGENSALETLNTFGNKAELFTDRTHNDNDIIVHNLLGDKIEYSVKSYNSVSELKRAILEHPNSDHYVVNTELYDKLKSDGLILKYHNEGIDIIDGHFSNIGDKKEALATFEDIHNGGDVAHHLPIVGVVFFGLKTINNVKKFQQFQESAYELGVNIVGDFVGIGGRTILGMGGAKVGATIGTIFTPGIGTIIGGGVGVVVGAIAASNIISKVKEKFKWGGIISALDHYGNIYRNGFGDLTREQIKNCILSYEEVEQKLNDEKLLLSKYTRELDPKDKTKVTLPAILCKIQYDRLNSLLNNMEGIVRKAESDIYDLCRKSANKMGGSKKRIEINNRRLLGELIINNPEIFMIDDDSYIVMLYKNGIKSAPNHPYRFSQSPKDIVNGFIYKNYLEYINGYSDKYISNNIFIYITLILVIIIIAIKLM